MEIGATSNAGSRQRSRQEWPQIRVLKRNSRRIWEVDTGTELSTRTRKRFDNEASATSYAEMLRAQRRSSGMSAFTPTAAQRENVRAALAMLRRSGEKFRQAAVSFANRGPMAEASKTMTDLWKELASFKDKLQQKSPEYMDELRTRLRNFTGQVQNQARPTRRKKKVSARKRGKAAGAKSSGGTRAKTRSGATRSKSNRSRASKPKASRATA